MTATDANVKAHPQGSSTVFPRILQTPREGTDTPSVGRDTLERRAISIAQACESVGVSRRTIYNWMAAGKVEYVRTAGGAVRIFEDTLWRSPESAGSLPSLKAVEQTRPRDAA